MSTNYSTGAGLLTKWGISLTNAVQQPEIALSMGELGYGTEKINEGTAKLAFTQQVYDVNKTEDDETSEAKEILKTVKKQLDQTYRKHRRRAKVVFMHEPVILQQLGIDGSVPGAHAEWMEMVRKFYTEAATPEILPRLELWQITAADTTAGIALVDDVVAARANYLREIGESQDATQAKDQAMGEMERWMRDFYAVARIALEDHPQLLEALGIVVRN
jgi:hypothetical protein